ncbi:MAG: MFS transporter [Streptosporangiales bacterium]|nr:MFS transporter [Streptosporangiales bacterium]
MKSRIPAYPWVLLGLLTGFWGLVGLNRLGITYLFPVIGKEFQLHGWQFGLLISGTSFTWAFSSWFFGWLGDQYGRRRVLLPGAALACVSTAAMGGAWNFWSMFVVRDLVGVGDGVGWPNAQATLAAAFPAKRRALAHSIFTSGYPLFGTVLGGIIVTALATALGWRPVFPIIGGVFLVVVLALYFVMREPPRQVSAESRPGLQWRPMLRVLRNRNVLLLMLVQAGALGWLQVTIGFGTLFLTEERGFALLAAGAIISIQGVAGLVGTLTLPSLSDFIGRKPAIFGGGVLSGICMTLYAFGSFNAVTSIVLFAASAFFIGVVIPLAAATCVVELVPEDAQGVSMGSINFVGVIIGTFALPLLAGVIADSFGLTSTIFLGAVCALLAGLLILGIPETAPRVLDRREKEVVEAAP